MVVFVDILAEVYGSPKISHHCQSAFSETSAVFLLTDSRGLLAAQSIAQCCSVGLRRLCLGDYTDQQKIKIQFSRGLP